MEIAEEDEELAAELEEAFASVETRLAALEEERLFSGKYDAGDALVTVNAGAGGTDAQDWAEMVLRMMMRWAERRGFKVELLEATAGEEAGIKSATFRAAARTPTGSTRPRRACTGSCGCRRSTPPTAARRPSPASRSRRWSRRRATSRSRTTTCRSTPTARRARAASTSTRPTRPCASPTSPSGIVVQCQNERSQSANRATAMAMLRSRLAELEERKRQEEIARERGEAQDVNFGSQIRSYVLHPYTMVKDHRTDFEVGSAERVLDGDLDGFVRAWLEASAKAGAASGDLRRGPRRRAGSPPGTRSPDQPSAPYMEAVVAYATRGSTRFHVPGHKGGAGADPGLRAALGWAALTADIPQDIEGIDLGPGADALPARRAAGRRGARRARARSSSPTAPRRATTRSASRSRRSAPRVVVQRNSHASVIDGLVLSGGRPTFVAPEYEEELGMAHGVTPESLARRAGAHAGGARRVHRLARPTTA